MKLQDKIKEAKRLGRIAFTSSDGVVIPHNNLELRKLIDTEGFDNRAKIMKAFLAMRAILLNEELGI